MDIDARILMYSLFSDYNYKNALFIYKSFKIYEKHIESISYFTTTYTTFFHNHINIYSFFYPCFRYSTNSFPARQPLANGGALSMGSCHGIIRKAWSWTKIGNVLECATILPRIDPNILQYIAKVVATFYLSRPHFWKVFRYRSIWTRPEYVWNISYSTLIIQHSILIDFSVCTTISLFVNISN